METQERVIGYVAVTIRKVHKKTPCPKPVPHKVCIQLCVYNYACDCACKCVLKDLSVHLYVLRKSLAGWSGLLIILATFF